MLALHADELFTDSRCLQLVDAINPNEIGVEDVRNVDSPAAYRELGERGDQTQCQQSSDVVPDDINWWVEP